MSRLKGWIRRRWRSRVSGKWVTGVRQGAPANEKSQWPAPWGPHCYLHQERHPAPFNKGWRGAQRRAERQAKQREREAALPTLVQDDGYFVMETWYDRQ